MRRPAVEHLVDERGGRDGLHLALELEVEVPARDVIDEHQSPERVRRFDLGGE